MKTWLILDCNYLCYRAQYTTGRLTNGVMFGFFRDVVSLMRRFQTTNVAFCWDHGRGLRERACPTYKQARREKVLTAKEKRARVEMRRQVELLKTQYIGTLFKNNFYHNGYEADDLIASICNVRELGTRYLIISADHDLYQLLEDGNVKLYNPHTKKLTTSYTFKNEFGVLPEQWAKVKALAGCRSDGVAGVRGIGEITACKIIANRAIQQKHIPTIHRNLPLVRLPYKGTPACPLVEHELDQDRWQLLLASLGLPSLAARARPDVTIRRTRLSRRTG